MESEISFILNQQTIFTKTNSATVLLDFIRKNNGLTGTKEVCKEGDCGACAVLIGSLENGSIVYRTINSCLYPIQKVHNTHIVTIEGLNSKQLSPIQESFINEGASQCGFCTPGFIISFTGYLLNTQNFNIDDAINAVAGNICRCTGYHSIKRSLEIFSEIKQPITTDNLINQGIIPRYFEDIAKRISELDNSANNLSKDIPAKLIGGGTDLFVQNPEELLKTNVEIIENKIHPKISMDAGKIFISGSATIEQLRDFLIANKTKLDLSQLFRLFASLPIRNSATIAGNIINASPIADITNVLIALDAILVLENEDHLTRKIKLNNFYKGYKIIDKLENEFIKEIEFNIPYKALFNFEKVSKRTHLDIASVNSSILVEVNSNIIKSCIISAGGVSPIPLYLKNTSEFFRDKIISNELISSSIEIMKSEINPISDIRGSAEYKTILLSKLIQAHFLTLFPEYVTNEVLN